MYYYYYYYYYYIVAPICRNIVETLRVFHRVTMMSMFHVFDCKVGPREVNNLSETEIERFIYDNFANDILYCIGLAC